MKKTLIICFILIFLLLLINTFILFFLFSDYKFLNNFKKVSINKNNTNIANLKIGYIQINKIEEKYEYIIKIKNEIKNFKDLNNNKLEYLLNNYNSKLKLLKNTKLQTNEVKKIYKDLEEMKNIYNELKINHEQELKELQSNKFNEIDLQITKFVSDFAVKNNYAFVFSGNENLIYYKNPIYNITPYIINLLNQDFYNKYPNYKK